MLAAAAGIAAHTWYLGQRAVLWASAPLSSPHDWYLAAAWVLAMLYVALLMYQPRASTGVFLLPVMLALIGVAFVLHYLGRTSAARSFLSASFATLFRAWLSSTIPMAASGAIAETAVLPGCVS